MKIISKQLEPVLRHYPNCNLNLEKTIDTYSKQSLKCTKKQESNVDIFPLIKKQKTNTGRY